MPQSSSGATPRSRRRRFLAQLALALVFGALSSRCSRPASDRFQGYVEGEFVYVASPLAGELERLAVQRGGQVLPGELLFALESGSEKAERDAAERRLAQARASLEDARKGKRPSEIEALEAQLGQARAALSLSELEFARQESLLPSGATAATDRDRARAARDRDVDRVAELTAELKTAHLGLRDDQVAAAEAEVKSREAALARAEWDLAQKRQSSLQAGLVFDTLYREGEWVPAGRPVVALLPPSHLKVRAFVPQAVVGTLRPGRHARIFVDGVDAPFPGKLSFISPQVEFTPPVIFSKESREKLVFMVELRFDDATAAKLNPGQPVDVSFAE
jgi:HlyD family secretion protein